MTHMTYSQLESCLNSMTTADLERLNGDVATIIRNRQRGEAAAIRDRLNVGDVVMVSLSRAGKVSFPQQGTVKKIKYTEAIVEVNGHQYGIPLNAISFGA